MKNAAKIINNGKLGYETYSFEANNSIEEGGQQYLVVKIYQYDRDRGLAYRIFTDYVSKIEAQRIERELRLGRYPYFYDIRDLIDGYELAVIPMLEDSKTIRKSAY